MAVTDIIILVFLGVCVFVGAKNGLIRQIGGIVGIFLGIYLSYLFSPALSSRISELVKMSPTVAKVISFILIIIGTLIIMSVIGRIMESLFSAVAIGWLNRLLGIVLSLSVGVLLSGVVLVILRYVDHNWFHVFEKAGISDSKLAEPILNIADKVFPYLKKIF